MGLTGQGHTIWSGHSIWSKASTWGKYLEPRPRLTPGIKDTETVLDNNAIYRTDASALATTFAYRWSWLPACIECSEI